jgi:two-component system sensor histidine kinase/response regulator
MARRQLPDLILTDIHMPGGDGSTLLQELRLDPALKSKQIVLMTGRLDLVSSRSGMDAGADDFLAKPVTRDALLHCIEARFKRAAISWRVEDQVLDQLRSSIPSHLPHEFFTPLGGIIGLTEILRGSGASLTAPEVDEIYRDIHQSALRLHRTLRNYLMILDLQEESAQTKLPPPLRAAEVKEAVRTGVDDALLLNEREADVTITVNGGCSLAIDAGDLSRILEELVDNACKFSRPGSPIRVELSDDRRLTITDAGRGLTAGEIKSIGAFQQFERKKYEQQGLGLGLILVQRLVKKSRAEFSMVSDPGKRTEVQIAFPLPT